MRDMDNIINLPADAEAYRLDRSACDNLPDAPKSHWICGECPQCAAPLVANMYYVGGRGFLYVHECWRSLDAAPTCLYRKVL